MDIESAENKQNLSAGSIEKALVTGANGFVGSHLVEGLLSKGYHVICLVRKTSNLRWLSGLNVEYVYADISEKESLSREAGSSGKNVLNDVDFVFHVAGLTKAKSKEEYFKANYEGTKNLLEAYVENNQQIKRFVYISSQAAVGPGKDDQPLDETAPCNPVTDYGKSKLEGEKIVLEFSSKLPVTIIRPPAVYGPRDSDILSFFKVANYGFKTFFGKGESYLSLCYIEDLIDGIILAAESPKATGQIYFIADDQIYSWKEAFRIVAKVLNKKTITLKIPKVFLYAIAFVSENVARLLGKPTVINVQKVREITQKYWLCDVSKAKRELGFSPQYPLEEGAKKTVRWYKEKGWL
jgi:nucleoside-diphosphate-sugar epimerase